MAKVAEKLNRALREKQSCSMTVAQITGYISGHTQTALDLFQVEVYEEKLEELYTKTDTLYTTILELCDPNDAPTQEQERTDLLEKVMEGIVGLRRIKKQLSPQQQQSQQHQAPTGSSLTTNLPKLDIQKFSGDSFRWRTFKDLFEATVHSATIAPAQKLQHLKTLVEGQALDAILGIPVTDSNYPIAWKILCDRYDDVNFLRTTYLNTLFNQPYLKNESPADLRKLWDVTSECQRNLQALQCPTDQWGYIFLHVVSQRLDPESRKLWQLHISDKTTVNLDLLEKFISHRSQALEAINPHYSQKKSENSKRVNASPQSSKKQAASHATTSTNKCDLCNLEHFIWKCPSFTGATPQQRSNLVKKHNLCFNCLRRGHGVSKCQSRHCSKCDKKHNTMLHEDNSSSSSSPPAEPKAEKAEDSSASQQQAASFHMGAKASHPTTVLLATASVLVKDGHGDFQKCRALLDPGSQASFVSEACAQRLRLRRTKAELGVTGVSDRTCSVSKSCVTLNISSALDANFATVAVAYVLPRVTTLIPTSTVKPNHWSHLQDLTLADANFHKPGDVDILIGADVYYDCLQDGFIPPRDGAPSAQRTIFGWVIAGPTKEPQQITVVCHHVSVTTDELLRKFWEIEEVPHASHYTREEEECETHFQRTHTRDSSGRYIVHLPFKSTAMPLGNSWYQARRRFFSLERRLHNNNNLFEQYKAFMDEYLALGHMHKVSPTDISPLEANSYFMPHQAVIRADSSTTKLRVVFDASAKSNNGNSLNDNLLVGPQVQSDLFSILLRFRQFPIALKSDCEKMYRQVLVRPADQPFQRIIWRSNPGDSLEIYELSTVTYGTASAPYLATRALVQLAIDEAADFPVASATLRKDCYVDDLMTSVSSEEEAIDLQRDLVSLLQRGGIPLRKWCSNNAAVMKAVPLEDREPKLSLSIDGENSTVKTLGVHWNTASDSFSFAVKLDNQSMYTRRTVLSDTARIYDPLGWLAPVTVLAKMIFQSLWKLDLSWDDELPKYNNKDCPYTRWDRFRNELPELEKLSIPRCVSHPSAACYELCGFSDASEKAYSAVIYVRSIASDGQIHVGLLTSKTRVAPTKVVTLPKLELCGAELLAKLLSHVSRELTLPITRIQTWTDSTIVLAWLATDPSKLKTFVAHRVSKIQQLIPYEHWSHVSGTDNPADPASRGIRPSELAHNELWWSGPSWLSYQELPSSSPEDPDMEQVTSEFKKSAVVSMATIVSPLMQRFSSFPKVTRVTAYVIRYVNNLRVHIGPKNLGPLTSCEYNNAQKKLISSAQQQDFAEEFSCIQEQNPLPRKSKLAGLQPMIDQDGLIRVGGRLDKADLPYEFKHPVVLPKDHPLTLLILRHCHHDNLHAGSALMQSVLRQHGFWVIRAKQQCRSTVRKCVPCARQRAETLTQVMADLPKDRLKAGYPFQIVGVDYAGPLEVKQIHGKSHKHWKIYVAVFVCFSTKAVHLEPVRDLTAEAFIGAFRRFCSIRGRPSCVYSDNATNFQGAAKELQALKALETDPEVINDLSSHGVTWKFIPSGSPHHGGLWESAVKSMKHHMIRVIGNNVLTFDQLDTLLCQISACMNSRPLHPQSTDPEDFSYLTPGHFLIMRAPLSLPDPDVTSLQENRLSLWQNIQQKLQNFWKAWKDDYLHTLQQRNKWQGDKVNVKLGDICIIKDENHKPHQWKMARIIATHPGSDGKVRVVTVSTGTGSYKRPIVKLCVLPVSE